MLDLCGRSRRSTWIIIGGALLTAALASAACADPMDGPDQQQQGGLPDQSGRSTTASPRQRQREKHRKARASAEKRWSGSLALVLGRCLSDSGAGADPSPETAPCLTDVDATDDNQSYGIAVGIQGSLSYTLTKRVSLNFSASYAPVPHLVLLSAGASYDQPLNKRLGLTHQISADAPFGVKGRPPADPISLSVSETARLTQGRYSFDASAFGGISFGNVLPISDNGAPDAIHPTLASRYRAINSELYLHPLLEAQLQRQLPREPERGITTTSPVVGIDFGAQDELTSRWSLESNLVVIDSLDANVPYPLLVDASPIGAALKLGKITLTLASTLGTYPAAGKVSYGVEFTTRWDF